MHKRVYLRYNMKTNGVAAFVGVMAVFFGAVATSRAINDDMKNIGGGSVTDQGRPATLSILRPVPVSAARGTDEPSETRAPKMTAAARERLATRVAAAEKNQRAAEAKAAQAQEKADKLRKSLVDAQIKLLTDAARENNQPKIDAAKREILRLTTTQ